ncbi:DUF1275 domain-containing protein [Pengzhenrongella sicca]|uniref:DUF1275 domain-containing protein n=2 Tax=Pengzhenrongella sicca TaxID=2819238 RepID=A0A8A4ZLY2_9MICO|nr:DUF1275 domain-containing protein [Pengzhenrongella sicca]
MLVLTFSTGVIDAVGYLGLDRVFTGNMTGNVVILAMALTGADGLPVDGPVVALAMFMLGALIAGRVLRLTPAGWSGRSTALFVAVGLLLAASAGAMLVLTQAQADDARLAITGALGLAMGVQAGAARHIGVKDVTTVVVTSTLAGLAFDSRFGHRVGQQWPRRLLAVVLIGAGAATGAILLDVHFGLGMGLSAALTLIVALLGHLGRPHPVDDAGGA